MGKQSADFLRKKFDFRWEVLDIIISGKSAIDSPRASKSVLDDADRFVRSYGYDLDNAIERAEGFGNFHEALNFIRKYFLQPENPDGLKIDIPRRILELERRARAFSAGEPERALAAGRQPRAASARLGLQYLEGDAHDRAYRQDIRTSYFADIQKQIFDRFYKVIHRDAEGRLFMGDRIDDPLRVDLVAFETKPKKSRDSTLLKLLHKPENVAEDIFDRVGIRFVTVTRLGA